MASEANTGSATDLEQPRCGAPRTMAIGGPTTIRFSAEYMRPRTLARGGQPDRGACSGASGRWVGFRRLVTSAEEDVDVHVVVVGCGRVGSSLARSLTEGGHTVAVIDKRPEAFARLPSDFTGQIDRRHRLRPRPAQGGRHRAGRRRSPRSPTATTRTSSSPGSPGRPSASSASWPASTTPGGRRSTSGSASPPSPPWPGPPSGCCAGSCPTRPAIEWIDPSARVSLVERTIAGGWAGHPLSRLEQPGRVRVAAVSRLGVAQVPRPTLVAQEGDVVYLAVASDALADVDAALAPARPREGTDAGRHRRRRQRRPLHRRAAAARPGTRS